MGNFIDLDQMAKLLLGERVERATATLPQTTAGALFTVAGGNVLITAIVGEVTTVIQTQANDTKLVANPTVGTDVDLCAALDISADEAGCLYSITGDFSDAMLGANGGAVEGIERQCIVAPGTIDLNCAASNTGSVKWTIWYVPLETGASIVAA